MRPSIIILLLTLSLAGCLDQRAWFQKFIPKDEDSFARRFIEAIQLGQYDTTDTMIDSSVKAEFTRNNLEQMQKYLNRGSPLAIETVGVNTVVEGNRTRSYLTYQIQFPESWMLGEMVVDKVDGNLSVLGAHFKTIPASLSEINGFTFKNKSLGHYIYFVFQLLLLLFIIYVVIIVIKSKIKRRWLWAIVTLIGICQLSMNWSTGDVYFQPINIRIPIVGANKAGLYAPWILYCNIPIGAIIFLVRRRKLRSNNIQRIVGSDMEDPLSSS